MLILESFGFKVSMMIKFPVFHALSTIELIEAKSIMEPLHFQQISAQSKIGILDPQHPPSRH